MRSFSRRIGGLAGRRSQLPCLKLSSFSRTLPPVSSATHGDIARNQATCQRWLSSTSQADQPPDQPPVQPPPEVTNYEFRAETEKLLDIVTNSIYTDKDIFLRELISNCSDALEKLRYQTQTRSEDIIDLEKELAIRITTDKEKQQVVIEDSGIGMTKEEIIENLGTIARSGSKSFLQQVQAGSATKENIIGQFGVGFYSAFMVGKSVDVYSKSAMKTGDQTVYKWSSTGSGKFALSEVPKAEVEADLAEFRGTRIVIHLKDDATEFATESAIMDAIRARSKFVSFPIYVNGTQANTVTAIWDRKAADISQDEYKEFYRYSTNNFDEPMHIVHFQADVPIDIKCLLFIPTFNMEQLSTGQRVDFGVNLYSRKVLVESNSDKIVPSWLRFLRGVIDSEDLPISLSRESVQNSRLLANIKELVTKRVLRFLKKEAEKNPKEYIDKFYKTYDNFLKEGVCTDAKYIDDVSKLLRFNSSSSGKEEYTSLDEYISRCKPDQDKIYYLVSPNYELGTASPYYEVFRSNDVEVLFLYSPLDEFSVTNIGKYADREIVSISSGLDMKLKQEEKKEETEDSKASSTSSEKLSLEEQSLLKGWLKGCLSDVVSEVRISDRLQGSPALIVDHESVSTRHLMKHLKQASNNFDMEKQILEVNPNHEILKTLNKLRKSTAEEAVAKLLARQVFDNALIAAGLVDDAREMLPRLNSLLEKLLQPTK